MAEAYYEPTPATDGASMNPVPGAVFQVYEISDTTFSTPLPLRVGAGNPTTTVAASDTLATLPGVYVTSPNFEHHWVSGSFVWRRDSIDGAKKSVEAAKNAAETVVTRANNGEFKGAKGDPGDKGADGSNVLPTSEAIQQELQSGPSAAILSATIASEVEPVKYASAATAANTKRLLSNLERGVSDVSLLIISDSTGNETTEWAYLTISDLAARYPAYTVEFAFWNETTGTAYQAPVTIQTGTGTYKLRVWCCARAGEIPGYVLGSRWNAAVAATAPDLVIINHGHNMSDPSSAAWREQTGRNQMFSLTEEVTATFPSAGLVLIAQNPTTVLGRESWQAIKANQWEEVASLRGYGFIDVHQAFIDYGPWAANLMLDTVHPNAAGSRLWADVVGEALKYSPEASVPSVQIPPLLLNAKNYADNHDFSAWAGTNPDGWTPNASATTAKDTTNVETGAQGCKVVANATSGIAQIEQSYNIANKGYRNLRGQLVTMAVRVFVPASNTGTVRIQVKDSTGSVNARAADIPTSTRDRFVWLFATKRLDPAATDLYLTLMSRTTGTALVDATFDRVYLVRGIIPQCG